jgi:membrane protein
MSARAGLSGSIGSNRRMDVKQIWGLAKDAVKAWSDDYAPSMGAALAYYTLFSIAPLLLIAIALAGIVFGEDAARGRIYAELSDLMGADGASAVEALLKNVNQPGKGILATLAGVVALLIGAMSVFGELQNALDRIWRAPLRPGGSNLLQLLRARLLSFGMVVGMGVLVLASLLLSTALAALGKWWAPMFGAWSLLAHGLDLVLGFGVVSLGFAMIYKVMPRVRIEWRDVWVGAAVTALLFTLGRFAIGFYLGRATFASGFGAAASLVVLLVWMYYSAQIFLLGAEFTRVYAHRFGSRCPDAPQPGSKPRLSVADAAAALAASRASLEVALRPKKRGVRT